jgi:DUF4097 and DUF4098 domain-containing protein YvlB
MEKLYSAFEKRNMAMKAGTLLIVASLLLVSAALADEIETEEFSFRIDSDGRISLENINGEIQITGSKGDEVYIKAHKKAEKQEYLDELKVLIDADSKYIRIETRHPDSKNFSFGWGKGNSGSVSYELTVPEAVNLDTISTVNGNIEISRVSGTVKAETVNGDLDVSGLASNVDLETVNGGILAVFDSLGSSQRVSAEAVNGKIEIKLPAETSARINAETINGSIDAKDFDLEVEKGYVGRELDGQIGSGEARISLDTVNGSIKIRKK